MNKVEWERWQDILMAGYIGERKDKTAKQICKDMFSDNEFLTKLFSNDKQKSDDAIYQHVNFIKNILKKHDTMELPKKYEVKIKLEKS